MGTPRLEVSYPYLRFDTQVRLCVEVRACSCPAVQTACGLLHFVTNTLRRGAEKAEESSMLLSCRFSVCRPTCVRSICNSGCVC